MKKKYLHIIMLTGITLSSFSGLGKHIKHNVGNEFTDKNFTANLKNYSKDIVSVIKSKHNPKIYENNKTKSIIKSGANEKDITHLSDSENAALISCIGALALIGAAIGIVVLGCEFFRGKAGVLRNVINYASADGIHPLIGLPVFGSCFVIGSGLIGAAVGFVIPYSIMLGVNAGK